MATTYAERSAVKAPVETASAAWEEAGYLVGPEAACLRRALQEAIVHIRQRQHREVLHRVVRIEPLRIEDLEAELRYYESEHGMSSEAFARAYAEGESRGLVEETALEWVMAYETWRIAQRARAAGREPTS